MGKLGRLGFLLGLVTTGGLAACFAAEDDVDASEDQVKAETDVSQILKSTLILDSGCTAVKVGPSHLLTAAHCVSGNDTFKAGKTITFKVASGATQNAVAPMIVDAGEDADAKAGTTVAPKKNKSTKEATVEKVVVYASWKDKCPDAKCPLGSTAAVEANDLAVILLDAELENIPTVPVDLDKVNDADPVLALGSGCSRLDATPGTAKTVKVQAVPAKAVNHTGSVFVDKKQLVGGDVTNKYIVTAGPGWSGVDSPGLCKNDIGGPLFRANHAAVVGITSNYTIAEAGKLAPTTILHARLDADSKVGPTLEKLGVKVVHSCSEDNACKKTEYTGGFPNGVSTNTGTNNGTGTTTPSDAGADALVPPPDAGKDSGKPPTTGDDDDDDDKDEARQGEVELGEEDKEERAPPNDGSGYDAGPKKKKKKVEGGCSAAPGSSGAPLFAPALGLGLVAAAVARRRRRAR